MVKMVNLGVVLKQGYTVLVFLVNAVWVCVYIKSVFVQRADILQVTLDAHSTQYFIYANNYD